MKTIGQTGVAMVLSALALATAVNGAHAQDLKQMLRGIGKAMKEGERDKAVQEPQRNIQPPAHSMPPPSTNLGQQASEALRSMPASRQDPPIELAAPTDESAAVRSLAKGLGVSDEDADLYVKLLPSIKRFHSVAQLQTPIGFKHLKLGSELAIRWEPGQSGAEVEWMAGAEPQGRNRPRPVSATADRWECWGIVWSPIKKCFLAATATLGTAFGEKIEVVEIIVTKPTYAYEPDRKIWQRAQLPRIVRISLEVEGGSAVEVARTFFNDLYKTQAGGQTKRLESELVNSRADCAAVNAKRVNDLTTDDLRLRQACSNALTGLLRAGEREVTRYEYAGSQGRTVIGQVTSSAGDVTAAVVMENGRYFEEVEKLPKLVESLRAEVTKRKATGAQKDF